MKGIKMNIRIKPIEADYFPSMIRQNKPFTFTRYGDGEWRCICGYSGKNCDGHPYTDKLQNALIRAVCANQDLIWGMQRKAMRDMGGQIKQFCEAEGIDRSWYDSDILHKLNCKGTLFPFVSAIKEKTFAIIGPKHVRNVDLPYAEFVQIPRRNCFLKCNGIYKRILDAVRKCDILLFSASMMTNVLMYRLYPIIGQDVTMIDCGSVWDVYCDVRSRGIFRDESTDWDHLYEVNFLGRQL